MRSLSKVLALLLGLASALVLPGPARADNAMLTFGELLQLQQLPLEAGRRSLTDEEVILYQNMEFYIVTVFEALHAANNSALSLHRDPLFCAPAGTFRFHEESAIAAMAARLAAAVLTQTEEIGASPARYDQKPASEVLLLGLRAAFPCSRGSGVMTAMRLDDR